MRTASGMMFLATTTSPSPARRAQVKRQMISPNQLLLNGMHEFGEEKIQIFCYCKILHFNIIVTSVSQWPVASPLWWRMHIPLVRSVRDMRSTRW